MTSLADNPLSLFLAVPGSTTGQRVQFFLDETEEPNHTAHPLFSELEELIVNKDGEMEWKETAR